MFATTKTQRKLCDGSKPGTAYFNLQPGRHELERVPNPKIKNGALWLVLKGTKIGMAEKAWRQWTNGVIIDDLSHPNFGKPADWGDFEIIIED